MQPSYPLAWPPGWPRTPKYERTPGAFKMPPGKTRVELKYELDRMGASNVVINSNVMTRADGLPYVKQPQTDDPGVVLYFVLDGSEVCIPCDRWATLDANLRAIGMAVAAIRGLDRWGTGQMVKAAFAGFTALPASATGGTPVRPKRNWYDVLGVPQFAPPELVKAAYNIAVKKAHPDGGGTQEDFDEVLTAFKEANGG